MRLLTGISLVAFGLLAMTKAEHDNVQALRAVVEAINQFSSSLYHTTREVHPGEHVLSPLSVAISLTMAGYGARGETERQFRSVLHMQSPDSFGTSGYQVLIDLLNNGQENKLVVASILIGIGNLAVKPSYKELIETYFRSTTKFIKSGEDWDAWDTILKWVEEIRGRLYDENLEITGGYSDFMWTSSHANRLVPWNFVAISAGWKDKFRVQDTTNMSFYVTKDEVTQTAMMTRTGVYRTGFIEELDAQFILIPYEGDELNMVILLPKEIDGLVEMERKMRNVSLSNTLLSGMRREVRLSLPKFEATDKLTNISSVLQKMGLVDAFTSQANFSGVADDHLTVDQFVYATKFPVNEEGCTNLAVKDGVVETDSTVIEPSPLVFKVDHPFIFSIVKSFRNPEYSSVDPIVIFTGCIMDPRND